MIGLGKSCNLPRETAADDCVVEIHDVGPAGGLPDLNHFDGGSLITLDVMLSRPGIDFGGGNFCTPEPLSPAAPSSSSSSTLPTTTKAGASLAAGLGGSMESAGSTGTGRSSNQEVGTSTESDVTRLNLESSATRVERGGEQEREGEGETSILCAFDSHSLALPLRRSPCRDRQVR